MLVKIFFFEIEISRRFHKLDVDYLSYFIRGFGGAVVFVDDYVVVPAELHHFAPRRLHTALDDFRAFRAAPLKPLAERFPVGRKEHYRNGVAAFFLDLARALRFVLEDDVCLPASSDLSTASRGVPVEIADVLGVFEHFALCDLFFKLLARNESNMICRRSRPAAARALSPRRNKRTRRSVS
jgi:hypothetical protein